MPDRTVNTALDAELDAALRRLPEVRIPPHFANRVANQVLDRVPPAPSESPVRPWILPALTLAGAATLASLGWTVISLGWAHWFSQPSVLATVVGIEAAASVAWVWRVYRSAR